jgi:predicted nucleic acid-binding protein
VTATRFTLDSNILVYATDRRDIARHDAAVEIIARAANHDCIIMVQAFAEFFHVVTRKGFVPRREAAEQVHRWMTVFAVSAGGSATALASAMEASASGRCQFYDALLLATARDAGCTAAISEDMADGAELNGIRVVSAFGAHGVIGADALALL